MDRRDWLRTGLFSSLAMSHWLTAKGEDQVGKTDRKRAKNCVLFFLEGGPSHIDTFDPKPGTKSGGPFQGIDTGIAGIQFSEHLPELAKASDKLAIIRSLHSKEGDHDRAQVLLHTGYVPTGALQYPSLGSWVAKERIDEEAVAPAFVSIGNAKGPGFLGPQFGPFVVQDVQNPGPNLMLPEGFPEKRLDRRLAALAKLNDQFGRKYDATIATDLTRLSQKANRLRHAAAMRPWDPAAEEPDGFKRYGGEVADGSLARRTMLARRMIENGVRFVEIEVGGWDTHADNFNQVKALCEQIDAAISGLINDLAERGLLEETLVVCFGEFGRTPSINGDNGRDHWADAFSAIIAGGPVVGGKVIGSTDDEGGQVQDRPVSVPDLHATLLYALGIDYKKQITTADGRPIGLTNKGEPISELFV